MPAKISVIIPTYNRASVLPRAIRSVLGQSFQDFELILVDDGSTDDTPPIIERFLSDSRVKSLKGPNRGVSFSRNWGVRESQADWVAFLDSDDEWLEDKLAKQWELLKKHPELNVVHGEEIWIRKGVRVNPMKKHKKSGGDVFSDSLRLCCISPSTVMLKKTLFEGVGGFREDFPVCEDYDLWLKITSAEPVGFVEEPIIRKYGGHDDQLSRKYKAMDYWRLLAMQDLLGKPLPENKYSQTLREIKKKRSVLLNGYRKHQNLENYDQIFCIHRNCIGSSQ